MGFTAQDVAAAVMRAKARMDTLEQELNAADAKLGDGDTGGMLARVLGKLAAQDVGAAADVGSAFGALARAAAQATGSSLGTLFATALLAASKATKGTTEVHWGALQGILNAAKEAMMGRGGASIGDKTVVDSLDAVADAIEGVCDLHEIRTKTVAAARDVLERLRDKPCRVGRARMFAEKSVGIDDPGMLAFARLAEAIAEKDPEPAA